MRRAQVSGPSQPVRNLSTNPSFETASGTVNVRTNLATNPSFEIAAGSGNIRTNLFNWSSFLLGAGASQTTGVVYSGSTWTRLSRAATGTAGFRALANAADLVNGEIYEAEWELANDGASAVTVQLDWCDSANLSFTIAPGERRRCKVTGIAGLTYNDTYRFSDIELVAASTSILFREILIEKTKILGPYFDGATPAAGDFTYAWSGTANASTSYQQAPGVQNISGGNCHAIISSDWKLSGAKSLRMIPSNNSFDSFASIGGDTGGMRTGLVAGKTYTVSATCRLAAVQSAGGIGPPRSIVIFSQVGSAGYVSAFSASAPNAIGSTRLSVTYTIPAGATEAFIRLYNGVSQGNGEVWWDDLLIEETSILQPYFDGANPITNLHTNPSLETNSNEWAYWAGASGGANATRETSGGFSGSAFYRVSWTTSQTANHAGGPYTDAPVREGGTYSSSIRVRANRSQVVATSIEWVNAAKNAQISVVTGPPVTLTANTWTELKLENLTAPAGAAYARITAYSASTGGTAWLAGDKLDADAAMVVVGSTAGPYYEGLGDFTYLWSGAANASTSIQQASGIADGSMVPELAVAYQSTLYAATGSSKSVRITPKSSTDTFVGLWASAANTIPWKPNTTYTIAGDRTIVAPQTNPSGLAFRVNIGTEMNISLKTPIANVAGTQRVVGTFTTGASTTLNFFRLYNGAAAGGGDVWWDNVVVVEGDYAGPYIDGSKPFSKWDGAANASTSVGYPYG